MKERTNEILAVTKVLPFVIFLNFLIMHGYFKGFHTGMKMIWPGQEKCKTSVQGRRKLNIHFTA